MRARVRTIIVEQMRFFDINFDLDILACSCHHALRRAGHRFLDGNARILQILHGVRSGLANRFQSVRRLLFLPLLRLLLLGLNRVWIGLSHLLQAIDACLGVRREGARAILAAKVL